MGGLVEVRKAVGARHPGQFSVGLVGPGVIGTDDPLGRHHVMAVDQPRSAVAADIGEHMGAAIVVTRQDEGRAIIVVRDRLASGREQRGWGQQMGQPVEN